MAAVPTVTTAGQVVALHDRSGGLDPLVRAAAGVPVLHDQAGEDRVDVALTLEHDRRRFDHAGLTPVTRGVWAASNGDAVVDSAGGSGFAQRWSADEDRLSVRSRWLPSAAESAAAALLRSRCRALRGQVLLHYPALWWATVHGMAPLHVSVVDLDDVVVLLAGPGGVGKSTLVARELDSGASATCDNLAVSDGVTAFGVAEPLRVPVTGGRAAGGRTTGGRTTHGRREHPWHGRVPALRPDIVVVVRRGAAGPPSVRPVTPDVAHRALVAGTFCAGELRRFWPLAAALGLATGRGPVLAPVDEVARRLTDRLPCYELQLGSEQGHSLRSLLAAQRVEVRRTAVTP
jgi:hypothetical protein